MSAVSRGSRPAGEVPAGVEYHRVLAGERRRVGRGLLAVLLLAAGLVLFPLLLTRAAALVDVQPGNLARGAPPGTV